MTTTATRRVTQVFGFTLALAALAPSARADLISHWTLNLSLTDSGPGGNDGTLPGGGTPTFEVGFDGRRSGAIVIDNITERVRFRNNSGLPVFRRGGYSIAFWVKGRPGRGAAYIFGEGFTDLPEPGFGIGRDPAASSNLLIRIDSTRGTPLNRLSSTKVLDGSWRHVVWTDNNGDATLWIDGEEDETDFSYAFEPILFDYTTLGALVRRTNPCCSFNGSIDDVRVYSHVLTRAEIHALCPPACAPLEINEIAPTLVSTAGGTPMAIEAPGVDSSHVVLLGGAELTRVSIDRATISGLSPSLPSGVHALEIRCANGAVAVSQPRAVEAAPPIIITSVTPDEIPLEGGIRVRIRGRSFRDVTIFGFGRRARLSDVAVAADGLSATATVPSWDAVSEGADDPTEPTFVDVFASDSRGLVRESNLVSYVPDPPPAPPVLTRVLPSQIPAGEGSVAVRVFGQNFSGETRVRFGRAFIGGSAVNAEGTEISGVAPTWRAASGSDDPLFEPMAVDVVAEDPRGDARLPDGVTYLPEPIELLRIDPATVNPRAGNRIRLFFENLPADALESMSVHFGNDQAEFATMPRANELESLTPALDPGTYSVSLRRGGTIVTQLARALTVEPEPVVPRQLVGPQQFETSLAGGEARFRWFNPEIYERIEVRDESGEEIMVLSGDATELNIAANGDHLQLQFVGVSSRGQFAISVADAIRAFCNGPVIAGNGTDGGGVFPLRGDHAPAQVERCADLVFNEEGDGGAGKIPGPDEPSFVQAPLVEDLGKLGAVQSPSAIGFIRPEWLQSVIPGNQITTGFLLPNDATVLEFAGFYHKIATKPGVELRGRLRHIESDFTDEFTFPNILIDTTKKDWHCVNYFRADRDIGTPPNPADPNDTGPQPCLDGEGTLKRIPAGRYLLDLYVVGGDNDVQYFAFGSDDRDYELLIPGSPCPPYPLVRVRDMTGRDTLPVITAIHGEAVSPENASGVWVSLEAFGTWIDGDGIPHKIGGAEGEPDNPEFEYVWTIYDKGGNPTTVCSGSAHQITTQVQELGCYYVDVEVRSKFCPRSTTRSYQIAIQPQDVECDLVYYSFLCPTPDPKGIRSVVGLIPPPGNGEFDTERPVEFRLLVAPRGFCQGQVVPAVYIDPNDPSQSDVLFDLVVASLVGDQPFVPFTDVDMIVEDLCPEVQNGLKYLHVRIEDLHKIPSVPGANGTNWKNVWFAGKTRRFDDGWPANHHLGDDSNGPTLVDDIWHPIGSAMRMLNHPPNLDHTFWNGFYDAQDATYRFSFKASHSTKEHYPIGPSKQVDFPVEGLPPGTGIPSFGNDLSSGTLPEFTIVGEDFVQEAAIGATHGDTLGNRMEGAPNIIQPGETIPDGIAGGLAFPEYHWESIDVLYDNTFRQEIFDAILYTGSIGPVPVTVWASISLAIDFLVGTNVTLDVRPFADLQGGGPRVETHAYLCGDVDIRIPCEVRADVLFGVASVATRLIPEANIDLDAHVGVIDGSPNSGLKMRAAFSLFFEVEACVWALFDEICYSPGRVPLVDDEELVSFSAGANFDTEACDFFEICGLLKQAAGLDCGDIIDGAGGGVADPTLKFLTTSRNSTAYSPDGSTWMQAFAVEAVSPPERTLGIFFTNEDNAFLVTQAIGDVIDPAVEFVTNERAFIVWTSGKAATSPVGTNVALMNSTAAQQDIVVAVVERNVADLWRRDENEPLIQVSDRSEEVAPSARRADGSAAIARDPSGAAVAAGGEAMVAWVRFEDSFLQIGTESQVIYEQPIGKVSAENPLTAKVIQNPIIPNLDATAIYARRVGIGGVLDGETKLSPPGINIAPTLATSPSGDTTYCIWVHDPEHENLTDSNLGRNLLIATYEKGVGWSAGAPVFANPDDYPGMLHPDLALQSDGSGMLVFTALGKGASENDTGLGSNRYVFASRFTEGVFETPELIHGRCLQPENGMYPSIAWTAGPNIDFDDPIGGGGGSFAPAEYVMTYHGLGPLGSRAGSGNVMSVAIGPASDAKWGAPVCLTDDERVHSNVATAISPGGVIHSMNLDGGWAQLRHRSEGRAGGIGGGKTLVSFDTEVLPDAAITVCRLSDSYPGPGGIVVATVDVENLGLACTPVDGNGESRLGVEIVFMDGDGRDEVVASATVPELAPGGGARLELDVEMPHDPGTIIARLFPNPIDRIATNNMRQCLFGAPTPEEFTCEARFYRDGAETVACLAWENPVRYEEIWVYRDGAMIASLTGGCTRFVDSYVEPGEHRYEVRGCIGVSKSVRAECTVDVPEPRDPNEDPQFRRGDVNDDGERNIADAIYSLNWLFGTAAEPICLDAADLNDDGQANIADAIFELNWLFGTGPDPARPGGECGFDPTADRLSCGDSTACE